MEETSRSWVRRLGAARPSRRVLLISAILAVVILVLGYFLAPSRFPHVVRLEPFPNTLILSLDAPINDKEGIPYSGVVRYDPVTETYAYIAASDGETITPLGATAFSSGPLYLATRQSESSTDLVLYDRTTYAEVRVVESLPSGSAATFAAWSADGERFAYVVARTASPFELKTGGVHVESATLSTPGIPVGLSPDGSKILLKTAPFLNLLDTASGELVRTSGTAFADPNTEFILSPSGAYLIALVNARIEWYVLDWTEGVITPAGVVVARNDVKDVAFMSDDTLLVREVGSDVAQLYAHRPESAAVLPAGAFWLPLPEGAHILQLLP